MKIPDKLLGEMAQAAGAPAKRRPAQFRLRSLFWLTAISAVLALAFPWLWERIRPWLEPRSPKPQVQQPQIEQPPSPSKFPRIGQGDYCPHCGRG